MGTGIVFAIIAAVTSIGVLLTICKYCPRSNFQYNRAMLAEKGGGEDGGEGEREQGDGEEEENHIYDEVHVISKLFAVVDMEPGL